MINIAHVKVSKNGLTLFDDLNLAIQDNEHWLITGDNGAGKTTLLELIAGNIIPTEGEVSYSFIEAKEWGERYAERKTKIHYLPAHALQVFLARHHDLFYQQRYYQVEDDFIPLVKDILKSDLDNHPDFNFPESLQIDSLLNLEVTKLSNGQLKKVFILKNLLKQVPKVLLLDYPFEGLDRESRKDLLDFLDNFSKAYQIQLIIVDQHYELPTVINKHLHLHNFKIVSTSDIEHYITSAKPGQPRNNPIEETKLVPVIEFKNLTIQYGRKKIIDGLNLVVNKGERWALTGRNGSGKTTLFSVIYADHPFAYSQQVFLFGKRRGSGESIWDIKKRINYIGPEHIHYLNAKTILSSAAAYIKAQHEKDITQELHLLTDFFDLQKVLNKQVRHLSSGELQMMMLVNFFLSDKELLLLDEPFQFLSEDQKSKVSEYLNHYLSDEKTVILITHYEEDIAQWTNHRMVLPSL